MKKKIISNTFGSGVGIALASLVSSSFVVITHKTVAINTFSHTQSVQVLHDLKNKNSTNKVFVSLSDSDKKDDPKPSSASSSSDDDSFFTLRTIGIICGTVALAVIILGLGIGIPMRKQHKISMLQAKLNGKRIDKLSNASAMAFKKVIEATGALDKKVTLLSNSVKTLNAASSEISAPTQSAKSTVNIAKTKSNSVASPNNQPLKK